jgi:GT2 family glycosyltransferase
MSTVPGVGDSARPVVDVGVVTWNTAELTATALRRLLDSDQGCVLRVLVHDNASTDDTVARLARDVPEADVVAGATNLGFAGGVNQLLARSDAPWFFAMNSDAWPEPGAIGTLVAAAEEHPRAALVAPRLERPDGTLEHSTHPFPSIRMAAIYATGRVKRLPPARAAELLLEPAWKHDVARSVDWAVGAAWLMRRSAIDDVGPLDESFFMYAEDLEWCWRARQHGWDIWFEPSALVRHVGDASGRQARDQRARTSVYLRNTNRFIRSAQGLPAALGYRGVSAIACARLAAACRLRGEASRAAFWWAQAKVHVTPGRGDSSRA